MALKILFENVVFPNLTTSQNRDT